MVGVCFQPSLSSIDRNQATCCGTSAFSLQTFAQPGVMAGSVSDLLARVEGWFPFGVGHDCKVADTNINANNLRVLLWCGIGLFHCVRNQQEVPFMGFVVPEPGRSNFGPFFEQLDLLIVSLVGNNHTTIECQDAHLLVHFQAIVFSILIGQSWKNNLKQDNEEASVGLGWELCDRPIPMVFPRMDGDPSWLGS